MNSPRQERAGAKESIFERLRLMRDCPVCGAYYHEPEAVLIESRGDNHLVHLTCQRCRSAMVAMVAVSALGMSSVGVTTDLSAADTKRIRRQPPVTEDQLLAFHQLLRRARQFEAMLCANHDSGRV